MENQTESQMIFQLQNNDFLRTSKQIGDVSRYREVEPVEYARDLPPGKIQCSR